MTLSYHARLMLMDHSKGTTNAMIHSAMKAEIMELRKAVRAQEKTMRSALNAQHRELSRLVKKTQLERDDARARTKTWRDHAMRYQKLATAKNSQRSVS